MRIAKLKSAYNTIIKMLFICKTILVVLLQWIHLASGHRCVFGLVTYPFIYFIIFTSYETLKLFIVNLKLGEKSNKFDCKLKKKKFIKRFFVYLHRIKSSAPFIIKQWIKVGVTLCFIYKHLIKL